jgi:CrcB protein
MSVASIFAVFGGAGFGALLRWALGSWLNPVFPTVPLGTLVANLTGGLLAGVASALFARHAALPPEGRLLVVTGFMGGLTTFSTFSVEVVTLIRRQELWWALGAAGVHLAGTLVMTGIGMLVVDALPGIA